MVTAPESVSSTFRLSRRLQIADEPVARKLLNLFERTRFLEQVSRAGNDLELDMCRGHSGLRFFVEANNGFVITADDEKRGCSHVGHCVAGEIGAAAPRHHSAYDCGTLGGGNQRRRCTGARAEVADRQAAEIGSTP